VGLSDAAEISTKGWHTCARRSSGEAVCWGSNGFGQLGDGTTTDQLVPAAVFGLTDILEIATGSFHSCARRSSGEVLCSGWNLYGQLGDGTTTDRILPTPVVGF